MSVIVHVYQRPRCVDDDTSAGDHDPASTQLQTTAEHNIERQPRFKSGKQTHGASQWTSSRGDQYLGDQRHGTLWTIKQWKRLAHHMLYVRCAAFFDTLSSGISDVDPDGTIRGHLACIATTGALKDEEQEEQCCESSGGSVNARQSPTERQPVNPVEEGAERLRSSTDCDPEGRQRCDVPRTEMCGNLAAHSADHGGTGSRDEAEQSHSALVDRETTSRDRTLPDTGA